MDYEAELAALQGTYSVGLEMPIESLIRLADALAGYDSVFVGSGGTLAVAQLAAEVHMRRTGRLSFSTTPLMLSAIPTMRDTAAVILSSRAAHPDVILAIQTAIDRQLRPTALVTQRQPSELRPAIRQPNVQLISLPKTEFRDGFLATNSVLLMATAFCRLVESQVGPLPKRLPALEQNATERLPLPRQRCIVLTGPGHWSAAIDLETRLSETGLSAVQVADYRNFAHGRHYGLWRNRDETTVIALIAPTCRPLAEATLRELPPDLDVIRLGTDLNWPASVLDLVGSSMKLVGRVASEVHANPSRPRVPSFGRRLYHLPAQRLLNRSRQGPVERKLLTLGVPMTREVHAMYTESFERWLEKLVAQDIKGLVLDYDGTVCTTTDRFDLPDTKIRSALLALLEADLMVGFASGRGSSLQRDLRQWVPSSRWSQVVLGLYNGAVQLKLADELPQSLAPNVDLTTLRERLEDEGLTVLLKLKERPLQLRVESRPHSSISGEALSRWVTALAARAPSLSLKVVASAHSVDITVPDASKVLVLADLENRTGGSVIAIGDQGQPGGNDFELLASTPYSLSVDRCSADPTRCWKLTDDETTGPDALHAYLDAIKTNAGGVRLHWPTV